MSMMLATMLLAHPGASQSQATQLPTPPRQTPNQLAKMQVLYDAFFWDVLLPLPPHSPATL